MSFLALGYKAKKIAGLIAAGKLTTVESVIAKAKDMQLAETYGLTQDPEKLDQWYTKLAENLFYKKEFIFPDFADIGFGEELVEKIADPLPTKKPRKFLVTRKSFPHWQDAVVVYSYTKEEALALLKVYYQDFEVRDSTERMGFAYTEPAPEKEDSYKWREINFRKQKTYANYLTELCTKQNQRQTPPKENRENRPLTDKTFFPPPRPGERRFELWGYLVIERGSQVLLYTGSPVFKKSVVQGTFEEVCARIQSYLDFCNE